MLEKAIIPGHGGGVVADATPLGLIGLAIGCAALVPIAFGASLTPAGLKTAAMFCLLFGAGGQFIAGILALVNRNAFGGTLFTAFSFNWVMNWWILSSLAEGRAPDHGILLATEATFLVIFLVFTYGFAFFNVLLFAFLVDIDVMFVFKLAKALTGSTAFDLPIALATVALAAIALWIAFAILVNPTAGRAIFKAGGPLLRAPVAPGFDFSVRRALFDTLYRAWQARGLVAVPLTELAAALPAERQGALVPELQYLAERGAVRLEAGGGPVSGACLTGAGIDLYEQRVLQKPS